ncbi:MAG: hypothetical protein EOM62_18345 [Bacteroidia bacterium]|nr:hypothetical protein [Bacteroidia bacterium]
MKKVFLFVFFVMLILYLSGCALFYRYDLNPPEWIIGRWTQGSDGFAFSNYDIAYIYSGTAISLRNQAESGDKLSESRWDVPGEEQYEISNLTTGERWVFSLSADRLHASINGASFGYFNRL